jgi:multicomponent Na+:H+ antiporter subunit E
VRRPALAVMIVVVWVLLWDRITLGQTIAGVVVAAVLLAVLREPESDGGIDLDVKPLGLLRLLVWFGGQVALSNFQVARAVLFPGRYVRPGVIHVPLRTRSHTITALVANLTALSPGMQPVGSSEEPPSIDVHILSLRSVEDATALVVELETRVLAAFTPRDVEEAP